MLARSFGGAERFFVDLSRVLGERGHRVLAICQRGAECLSHLRGFQGLEVAQVPVAGAWDPFAVRAVRRHVRAFAPAVVQAHLARAAHIAGKALTSSDLPLVAKTHNYVKLKYYRRVDVFIPTTADQSAYLRGQGIAEDRVQQIPNFCAIPAVAGVPTAARPEYLVTLGRMVAKKGFHILLESLARLGTAGCRIELRLGGEGPERGKLQRAARALNVEQQVKFEGWQTNVPGFLKGAALFVLPSLDEPFGISLLEAMACGIPIIATLTQGPREILNEDCAWLVPPGDAAALADSIARALDEPDRRQRKAALALERFKHEFAADVVVPRIESLYRRLAGDPGKR